MTTAAQMALPIDSELQCMLNQFVPLYLDCRRTERELADVRAELRALEDQHGLRACSMCPTVAPLDEFPRSARYRRGRTRECRVCARRRYRRHYRQLVGFTDALVAQRLEEQAGGCAICKADIDEASARADHCHRTGTPRGLLCNGCNSGLGLFAENTAALRAAADYVEHWRDA